MEQRRALARHRLHPVTALLLLLALALRLGVPAGYMPSMSADGSGLPALVICTVDGAVTLDRRGTDHGPATPVQPDQAAHPCPYAALGAPLVAAGGIDLAEAQPVHAPASRPPAISVRAAPPLAAPPPPARAPPAAA
jgi:hypothetical protein